MPTLEYLAEIDNLKIEVMKLRDALIFYADKENRSACLISAPEFTEKYFDRAYIVDFYDTPYAKDNGKIAEQALHKNGSVD